MKYLMIDTDGQPTQQTIEPTQDELQNVMDGDIQIYRFHVGSFEFGEVREVELEGTEDETELLLEWVSV